ncbi:hypothetical protein FQZ97_914520 [compost metagenome]
MHQQAAEKGAERLQVFAAGAGHIVIGIGAVLIGHALAGCDAVIHAVEPEGDADDHGGDGQGIEEGREEGRQHAEQQGQQRLAAYPEEQAGEQQEQQVLHEIDARHHEHQQQDDREVVLQLLVHRPGRRQAQQQRLHHQQAAGQQRVALQGHGQGEDEFPDQQPGADHRAEQPEHQRVEHQEGDYRQLVPVGRVAEEIVAEGCGGRGGHRGVLGLVVVWRAQGRCQPGPARSSV